LAQRSIGSAALCPLEEHKRQSAQRREQREERRRDDGAFRDIDQPMALPRVKPDPTARELEPRAAPRPRLQPPQRMDRRAAQALMRERGIEPGELGGGIGITVEMLQRAAAALAEMAAGGLHTRAGHEQLIERRRPALAAAAQQPRAQLIARRGKGQKDRLAAPASDAVAALA